MIHGNKVKNPTKQEMAAAIANALGIDVPDVSEGSSVDSTFLDRIHAALGYSDSAGPVAYRKAERLLQDLGLTYDPFWDTSEAQERGGSTVTNRAYSRIRAAVIGTPRCFIFNTTDAPAGAKWETDHQSIYRFDATVTGRAPLKDAGPGSRIVFYSTSKSRHHPKHFIAVAEVDYIAPGWTGPWEALITGYTELPAPVPGSTLDMDGWNHQHAITEITWGTYQAILEAGGPSSSGAGTTGQTDPGAAVAAKRVLTDFPAEAGVATLVVPDVLPAGTVIPAPAAAPTYVESEDHESVTTTNLPPRPTNVERNREAEQRAVTLTRLALEADGWTLTRDCQKDGIGYDLRFAKDARELHVEVKGVQSSTLAFNMTPKETWRLETDPDFVVVAVTSVLSPRDYKLHLLTRMQLASASRIVTGYRLDCHSDRALHSSASAPA